MTAEIDRLLSRYESGQISRPELLGALAALTVAAPMVAGPEPAVGTVSSLNHVTVFVEDVQRSVEFYQRLFGMPVATRQGLGVNLRAGSGFLGLYPAREGRAIGIDHVCFGFPGFDADTVLDKLAAAGVKGRVLQRGETKELYFKDPDNVRVQLQDPGYRGGVGPLGDRDPE